MEEIEMNLSPNASEARYRASMYRNLSALFSDAPSVETLRALIESACSVQADDVWRASETDFYAYLQGLSGRDLDELRTQVASEYAELFVGPRPPLAPYYESVYLGSQSRLFTEQTMSVRRFYERCGLSVVKDGKVPDDFIAYELELMATLAGREADAFDRGQVDKALELERMQREFLVVHLGGWMALFASRIAEAPCSDFYQALSRFTLEFTSEDDAYLADAVRALESAVVNSSHPSETGAYVMVQD